MRETTSLRGAGRCTAALLVLLAACSGGGDSGSGPPPPPAVTVAKAPVSGNAQTGTVGQALASPIRVLVTRDGLPEVGTTVTWSAPGTGASVAPPSGVTDAAGLAATSWTLPQAAGAKTATAAVAGAGGSPVSFTATALPGPATQLALESGNGQTGEVSTVLAIPLKVRAADQFGNGVAGIVISWLATGGGGSVAPPTSTTDASGATTVWTLGATLGAQSAQGTAAGLAGSPVAFAATAVPPPPFTVDVSVTNNAFTPSAITIAAGTRVRWTWGATGAIPHSVESTGTGLPGSPTFTSSTTMTGAGAVYTFTFLAPGTYTYDCAVHLGLMTGTVIVN